MTDGTLDPKPLKETVELANKARSMGVIVYCVGVKEYLQEQLDVIADSKEHAIGLTGGFQALESVTGELSKNSCIQIVSVEPSSVCTGEKYEVVVRGSGFHNARNKEDVLCSFKFSDTNVVRQTITQMRKALGTLSCI
ncbi:anthrax toxin receptor-like isoform 2-T2 [Dugong dugon]